MSTRYVWEKYSTKKEWEQSSVKTIKFGNSYPSAASEITEVFDETTGELKGVKLSGEVVPMYGSTANNYRYIGEYPYVGVNGITNTVYGEPDYDEPATDWVFYGNVYVYMASQKSIDGRPDYNTRVPFFSKKIKDGKGDFISYVSSTNENTYPTGSGGAVSGGFWYIYNGSDSIDPSSIAYPTEDLDPERQITISVTAGNGKVYGGTVFYHYQYSRNGGNWTDLAKTTSLSMYYTIPDGTTSIRFRVYASDDMGFTSTTYITGPTVSVSQLKGYVGVAGKARKAEKIYIGVNGKARQVIKGYVGVNGKARKFL